MNSLCDMAAYLSSVILFFVQYREFLTASTHSLHLLHLEFFVDCGEIDVAVLAGWLLPSFPLSRTLSIPCCCVYGELERERVQSRRLSTEAEAAAV